MKHRKATSKEYNHTSRQGTVTVSMGEIAAIFGPPHGNFDLSHFQWGIMFENGDVATIYDHKGATKSQLRNERYPWHVGGHSKAALALVTDALDIYFIKQRIDRMLTTPLDARTPEVCFLANGKKVESIEDYPPHDTRDPDNNCRCVVVPVVFNKLC